MPPIHDYHCDKCDTDLPNQFRHPSDEAPLCKDCGKPMIKLFTSKVSISIQEPWRMSKDRLSIHSQNKAK